MSQKHILALMLVITALFPSVGAVAAICGVVLSRESSPIGSMDYYTGKPGMVYAYEQTVVEAPAVFRRNGPVQVWSQYLGKTTHEGKTLYKFRSVTRQPGHLGAERSVSANESYTAPYEIKSTETQPRFEVSYQQGTEDGQPVGVADNSVFLANLPVGSRGKYFLVQNLPNSAGPKIQIVTEVDYSISILDEIQTGAGKFSNVKQIEVKYTTSGPNGKPHVHRIFERYAKGVGYVQSESLVDVDVAGGSGSEQAVMRSVYQLVKMPYYSATPVEASP